jgi:hypothetical protein
MLTLANVTPRTELAKLTGPVEPIVLHRRARRPATPSRLKNANGNENHIFERQIQYVMGSGNHARTYLNIDSAGKLMRYGAILAVQADGLRRPQISAALHVEARVAQGAVKYPNVTRAE